jgi:hypothetical protein
MADRGFFMRIGSATISAILHSPLHRILSGSFLTITIRGRKTGKPIRLPVNYYRHADCLRVTSLRSRTWWRNLRGGYSVDLRLQGKEVKAWGTVIEDDQGVVDALASHFRQSPSAARAYKTPLDAAGDPGMETIQQLARSRVIVELRIANQVE